MLRYPGGKLRGQEAKVASTVVQQTLLEVLLEEQAVLAQ